MVGLSARVAVGLPVALLLPLSIGELRRSRVATLIASSILTVYALFTAPVRVDYLLVAVATVASTYLLRPVVDRIDPPLPAAAVRRGTWKHLSDQAYLSLPLLVPLVLVLVALGLFRHPAFSIVASCLHVLQDNNLAVMTLGGLGAIFVGGLLVGYIVQPLAARIPSGQSAAGQSTAGSSMRLLEAGTHIGWIERALFFTFFVEGEPEAAALALAAKSFVRAPDVQGGGADAKSEYYLVGSLASVSVTLAIAVLIRLVLGRSAV